MNTLTFPFATTILIGLGATLTFDLWGLFLKHAFRIAPANICLVGRWLLYMAHGTFSHANIVSTPPKRAECAVGWLAHYLIGVSFAGVFVLIAGNDWLLQPRLIPAVLFGVVTVLAPFLIMQPAFGFGFAASQTSNPAQARLRSLMNHGAFGVGLFVFGLMVKGCWL